MFTCANCGSVLYVDATDKVRLDLAKSLGVGTASCTYELVYRCLSCGLSFTTYRTDPGLPSADDYGCSLMELTFGK